MPKEQFSDEYIEATLLRKLFKKRCFGKGHMSESNLPKGFPSHLRKRVLGIADKLLREGLLQKHPTHHEMQWNINVNRMDETRSRVRKFHPEYDI